jgi:hypothetical protein
MKGKVFFCFRLFQLVAAITIVSFTQRLALGFRSLIMGNSYKVVTKFDAEWVFHRNIETVIRFPLKDVEF